MQPPLVSVIIPIYNVGLFLEECLQSVCAQTYTQLEILLVDDCSTDASAQIAQVFIDRDKRISLLQHDQNQGLGQARNTALDAATGKYVCFVDSDDKLRPNAIEKLVSLAEKYPVDIAIANTYEIFSSDCQHLAYRFAMRSWQDDNNTPVRAEEPFVFASTDHDFFIHSCFAVWNRLYRRDFLEKHALRFTSRVYEDLFFTVRCFYLSRLIIYTKESLYLYRIRMASQPQSLSGGKIYASIVDEFQQTFDWLNHYEWKNPSVLAQKFLSSFYHNALSLGAIAFRIRGDRYAYWEKSRQLLHQILSFPPPPPPPPPPKSLRLARAGRYLKKRSHKRAIVFYLLLPYEENVFYQRWFYYHHRPGRLRDRLPKILRRADPVGLLVRFVILPLRFRKWWNTTIDAAVLLSDRTPFD